MPGVGVLIGRQVGVYAGGSLKGLNSSINLVFETFTDGVTSISIGILDGEFAIYYTDTLEVIRNIN